MTRQDALISIAQTLLRRFYCADELMKAGGRPSNENIRHAVARAAQLIGPTDDECQNARAELDRRYTVLYRL